MAINFATATPAELEAAGYTFIKLPTATAEDMEAIHGCKLLWADRKLEDTEFSSKQAEELMETLLTSEEEAWEAEIDDLALA